MRSAVLCVCSALKNSLTDSEEKGFIKVVVDSKTDKVLGIHLVGPEVAEILQVSPPEQTLALICFISLGKFESSLMT